MSRIEPHSDAVARCPCLSGQSYADCCAPILYADAVAPTAERLMRSRFTAFVRGDAEYLLESWHPRTRPKTLELDAGQLWYRLDIISTSDDAFLNRAASTSSASTVNIPNTSLVEFRAHFRRIDEAGLRSSGSQHEVSRFIENSGRWFYLDEWP